KPSRFARRAIQQTYRTTFRSQAGDVVCEADSWCFRTERDTARERGKYQAAEPPRYTAGEIDAIAAAYGKEAARGRTPRYWRDSPGSGTGSPTGCATPDSCAGSTSACSGTT